LQYLRGLLAVFTRREGVQSHKRHVREFFRQTFQSPQRFVLRLAAMDEGNQLQVPGLPYQGTH
jgi:hypothetical protein